MRYFLLVFFIVFTATAQETINQTIRKRNDAAMAIYPKDPNLALKQLLVIEKEAKQLKHNTSLAFTINNIGIVTRVVGDFEKAITYSNQSLKLTKDSLIVASAYNNIGSCKRNIGLYEEALKAYLKAIKIYDAKKDVKNQAIVNNNLGLVYRSLEMNLKAKEYHQKAIQSFEQLKDKKGLSEAYNNMAVIYAYEDSLKIALNYFKYSLKIEEELKDVKGIAESVNNIGGVYYYLEKLDSALLFFEKARKIDYSIKNYGGLAATYNNIGDVHLYKQDYKKAKMNFDSAYSFAKKSKSAFDIENTLNYYALLYEAQNDYKKASDYYKKKNEFKDSIQKLSNIKQLHELETKYQTAKKDATIASSKAIIAERELKIKQKNMLIYSVLIFAFLLGLLGYLFYKQQKIKNQQLIKENELKEALIKIENQNNLQEQRLTISKDLHDNIGSQLTFIISSLDNLKYFEFNKDKLYDKFDSIGTFTRSTITDLRDTIWAMNKEEITFEDLKTRTTNFIEAAKTSLLGITFEFNYPENAPVDSLNSLQGIDVYRIIQEAVNNAIKHAKATKIIVNFELDKEELTISILDNGIGFDAATIEAGNGLQSMQKRAKEINAILTIDSLENGTKVNLKFHL